MDREKGRYSFHTQSFAWVWHERVQPKKPRIPRPDVIALRVASIEEKQMLLAADTETFFTDAHYNDYSVVLVRLAAIDVEELRELITDAWRSLAPASLVSDFDARAASAS